MPRCSTGGRSSILPKGFSFAASASWAPTASNCPALPRRCASGCAPMACSPRSSRGSCGSSCRSTPMASAVLGKLFETYPIERVSRTGGGVMARRDASDLAVASARHAEAVCRHYLSDGRRQGNYWLVGDVRNTPGRSMFVRLRESRKGRCRKMARRRDGRKWRSARRDPRNSRPAPNSPMSREEARRFLSLPHPRIGARRRSTTDASAIRFIRSGAAAIGDVPADRRHNRRNLFAQTRHHGFPRNRPISASIRAAIIGQMTMARPQTWPAHDRRRHRFCRADHRRASHLAFA